MHELGYAFFWLSTKRILFNTTQSLATWPSTCPPGLSQPGLAPPGAAWLVAAHLSAVCISAYRLFCNLATGLPLLSLSPPSLSCLAACIRLPGLPSVLAWPAACSACSSTVSTPPDTSPAVPPRLSSIPKKLDLPPFPS